MTHEQILTKAITQAIAGGWDAEVYMAWENGHHEGILKWLIQNKMWKQFIFNHDFAKALWGEMPEIAYQYHSSIFRKPEQLLISGAFLGWQYHLQQMVIANDPIACLGENI